MLQKKYFEQVTYSEEGFLDIFKKKISDDDKMKYSGSLFLLKELKLINKDSFISFYIKLNDALNDKLHEIEKIDKEISSIDAQLLKLSKESPNEDAIIGPCKKILNLFQDADKLFEKVLKAAGSVNHDFSGNWKNAPQPPAYITELTISDLKGFDISNKFGWWTKVTNPYDGCDGLESIINYSNKKSYSKILDLLEFSQVSYGHAIFYDLYFNMKHLIEDCKK